MKKLMITMAAIALAGVVNAAALNWGSGGYLWDVSKDAKATSITGGSIVLCLINDGSDYTKGVTDLDTAVLVTSGMAAAVGKVKGSDEGAYSFTYGATGTPKNGDVLTVLFKNDAGKYSQLSYLDGSAVTDTYTVSGLSGDSSVLAGFTFAASGNFQTVPEPTSGLLMLLGVAGLALRRRRA